MPVRLPVVAVAFLLASPVAHRPDAALRWDETGHRTIAGIAYERLAPTTRARVDSLLRQHPDYATLARGVGPGSPDLALEVFMRAAVWPDVLRGDSRFYNEASPNAAPTPLLPG